MKKEWKDIQVGDFVIDDYLERRKILEIGASKKTLLVSMVGNLDFANHWFTIKQLEEDDWTIEEPKRILSRDEECAEIIKNGFSSSYTTEAAAEYKEKIRKEVIAELQEKLLDTPFCTERHYCKNDILKLFE